jgi:prophage tail gpP-like protein
MNRVTAAGAGGVVARTAGLCLWRGAAHGRSTALVPYLGPRPAQREAAYGDKSPSDKAKKDKQKKDKGAKDDKQQQKKKDDAAAPTDTAKAAPKKK